MRIASFSMKNFRSFVDSGDVELTSINVFIGSNNAGKSTVLRGLHYVQDGVDNGRYCDVRVGQSQAEILYQVEGADITKGYLCASDNGIVSSMRVILTKGAGVSTGWQGQVIKTDGGRVGVNKIPPFEPNHFVVPFLSKRKAVSYIEDVRKEHVQRVDPDVSYLAAKLSRLANPAYPAHEQYSAACRAILGFVVTAIPASSGQLPGVYIDDDETLAIDQMGEGIPNIVQLLVCLVTSKGKLILIEEPENDLHPQALKALLGLVADSAQSNQFVISTHSNIVVQYLCGLPNSSLYKVASDYQVNPPASKISLVAPASEARISVLQELGYAFSDFDLWDGWLILEESSAERVIRDYIIPFFAPRLSRLRTISAGGVDKIEAVLDDFVRLMVFTNLQPVYSGKTWVRVDGDVRGSRVVEELRQKFSGWPARRIECFVEGQFERFYPFVFADEVQKTLAISDRQKKRNAKRELLNDVIKWLEGDLDRARHALQESAASVIEDMKLIESDLLKSS